MMGEGISKSGFLLGIVIFCLAWAERAAAQNPTIQTRADSTQSTGFQRFRNETRAFQDSIFPRPDSSAQRVDSISQKVFKLKINDDALDAPVEYSAEDSMYFDVKNKQVFLWGRATMRYKSIDLKSDYIVLDYGKNQVTAMQRWDSTGRLFGPAPEFKDGDQNFTAKKLKYNFKTQKGLVFDAHTKQDELYVVSQKAKFVSNGKQDSTAKTTVYNANALLTTCDEPSPHFGIHASKLKVIPDKMIIIGPSYVEIGGIPTPLVLPFGFFPITKTKKQGLLLPRDFSYSPTLGLGFQNIGYYLPISDHMDATFYLEWYLRGTWGAKGELRYNKRYKYDGGLNLGYRKQVTENEFGKKVGAPSFELRWSHRQATTAHPTRSFGGSINIQTNSYASTARNDYNSVFKNQLSSNLNYNQRFPDKPFSLSSSFQHSQNTSDHSIRVSFPNVDFQMQRIFPFKKKERVGAEKWWERISLNGSSRLQNEFVGRDDSIFTPGYLNRVWQNKRFGVETRAASDVQFTLLKYFNFTPTVSYTEAEYLTSTRKFFDPRPVYKISEVKTVDPLTGEKIYDFKVDTAQYGRVMTERVQGFQSYREFSTGAGLTTSLFGTAQFRRGWLRGIRHKMVPSVSFSYVPYLGGAYLDSVQTSIKTGQTKKQVYSILENELFLKPSLTGKDRAALSFSLGNTLEAKVWNRRDSATKKITILRSLSFTGSYDLNADSLNWSQIMTGANFPLLKSLSNLQIGIALDPYIMEKGHRVNKFAFRERGKLLTMPRFSIGLNTGITVKQLRNIFSGKKESGDGEASKNSGPTKPTDDFLSLFDNFSLSHNLNFERKLLDGGRDTFLLTTNSLDTRGNIPLTSHWSINVSHIGYDFINKTISYPDLGFSRDMHCWEMSFSWQPVRGTYNFYLSVKPGTLDFLKLKRQKNNVDALNGF